MFVVLPVEIPKFEQQVRVITCIKAVEQVSPSEVCLND